MMRELRTEGVICLQDDETRIEYSLCDLALTEREDGSFTWEFSPRWAVVDLLAPPLFQGIPGLNLDLRLDRYMRDNRTPVFVSERAPAENREDVRALLDGVGLGYLNKLEWLIRTDTRYPGDPLYVRAVTPEDGLSVAKVGDLSDAGPKSAQAMRVILEHLAAGRTVEGDGFVVDGSNRESTHSLIRALYLKERKHLGGRLAEGRARARLDGGAAGRRPMSLDDVALGDVIERYESGQLGVDQAAAELGISRSTFFRRLKARRC